MLSFFYALHIILGMLSDPEHVIVKMLYACMFAWNDRDQVKNLRINEVCLPGVIYSKFALASNDKSDCNTEDFIKADLS